MEEFVAYIIMNLVSKPDSVEVKTVETQRGITLEVRLNKSDIGRVVGHKGKTIQALRTITSIIGVRLQRRIQIEIIEGEATSPSTLIESPDSQELDSKSSIKEETTETTETLKLTSPNEKITEITETLNLSSAN